MSCGKFAPDDGFPAMCKEARAGIAAGWPTTGVNVACPAPAVGGAVQAELRRKPSQHLNSASRNIELTTMRTQLADERASEC